MWINFEQSLGQRLELKELNSSQNRAKNLRSKGAAIVRGVAGSGKSLILRNRAEKLLEDFEQILVLTYNRFMNGWLKSQLEASQFNKVECKTFHQWAYKHLKYSYDDDISKLVKLAHKSTKRYQAILIDEAQDFPDEWFQALLEVLDSRTKALFIVYDNTQSVYGQPHRRKSDWSWKSLGINIPGGRSQVFDLNYRNSPEILELAWKFITPALEIADIKVEKRQRDEAGKVIYTPSIGSIIEPKKKLSRSSGIQPLLLEVYYEDMPDKIAYQIQQALQTHPESSIGILLHPQAQDLKQEISKELTTLNIEHHAPETSRDRDGNVVSQPYVIVDSWNALKGVEFDAVIIAGVDSLSEYKPENAEISFETKAGLYTAMTRAKDHLVMLYETKDVIVAEIEAALNSADCLDSET
ncbi:UvrD-helicase domain-containing protein [Pleurocapsa sp. PCC 7319]|uniref:UvrD-helicase domain-containing protein n=1 Tax=Pleurocapsa sp. PCC 7319 TaxID=118161 RepID=UPI0003449550|nr:UvrD-helicase domain-containing protein [Pleurocapsa sp. PCC 7319]